MRRDGKVDEAEALQAESRDLGLHEKDLDAESDRLAGEVRNLLLHIPNIPAADAPDGANATDNVVLEVVGDLSRRHPGRPPARPSLGHRQRPRRSSTSNAP